MAKIWHSVWSRLEEGESWLFHGWYLGDEHDNAFLQEYGCETLRAVPYGREGQSGGRDCRSSWGALESHSELRPDRHRWSMYKPRWHPVWSRAWGGGPRFDGWLYAGPNDVETITRQGVMVT